MVLKAYLFWYLGSSIGQSRLICQGLCSGMQVISALVPAGTLAEEGSSAKFCVVHASHLCSGTGGVSAKVGFICQVLCKCMQVNSALVVGRGAIGQSRVFSHVFM